MPKQCSEGEQNSSQLMYIPLLSIVKQRKPSPTDATLMAYGYLSRLLQMPHLGPQSFNSVFVKRDAVGVTVRGQSDAGILSEVICFLSLRTPMLKDWVKVSPTMLLRE